MRDASREARAPGHVSSASHLTTPLQDTTRIVQVGRNAWREASADDSGLIIDAADYYRAFYWSAFEARHYILMSGWQFDSGVVLLRGADAPAGAEVRFIKFLDGLCKRTPGLQVCILAWDFSLVFAGEREWMQRLFFQWTTNPRLQFLYDDCAILGGSHHQKFIVIDGQLAFLGGMDVCESRWDDRRHRGDNPLRLSRGRPSKPYHDVQAYLAGRQATRVLEDLFLERWTNACGKDLSLTAVEGTRAPAVPRRGLLRFGATRVAFSRTDPRPDGGTIREVERLLIDAIEAAERLIYVETQYFSSQRIYEALAARMRAAGRTRLEIVVVVNERAEALKEELAVGLRQAENLQRLREVATETGDALGLYWSLCNGATDAFRATYIHSKILLVDDRFLTVGSANLTNRSMGTDSELHAAWEANAVGVQDGRLVRSIRRARVSLLAEHAGVVGIPAIRGLVRIEGLVDRLDELTAQPGARLQRHRPPSPAQLAVMQIVDPENLPFDPDTSGDRETADEPSDEAPEGLLDRLYGAIGSLWRYLGFR